MTNECSVYASVAMVNPHNEIFYKKIERRRISIANYEIF